MRYTGRRNRGGWPYKAKTIFDAAAMRRADRALNRLANAKQRLLETRDRSETTPWGEGIYDDVTGRGDRATSEALDLLDAAMRRVHDEAKAANAAAKAKDQLTRNG